MKFEDIAKEWLDYKKIEVKQSTYCNYAFIINKYLNKEFGRLDIEKISNFNIYVQKWSESLKSKTVRDIVNVLKAILNYYEDEYNKKLDYRRINMPKIEKSHLQILTKHEKAKIERYCLDQGDLMAIGIIIAMYTGMRIGELCALKWENIDLKAKNIYVKQTLQRVYDSNLRKSNIIIDKPKTENSVRTIPINSKLYEILSEIIKKYKNTDYFLSGSSEKYIEPRKYQNYFKSVLKKSKVKDYKFHILRHTFATNCIEVGMDIKSLSEVLGHSDINITLKTYVHSSRKIKKKYLEKL